MSEGSFDDTDEAGQERPVFSIIIPTYNRPKQLVACLQAFTRLDYPRDRFEVIVVDDGSKTPPEAVVAAFRARLQVTLILQPHTGPAIARNTGALQAKGRFLTFTDDDCAPAADWLQALTAHFVQIPNHMIGGRTINAVPDNLYSAASQLLVDYVYAYSNTGLNQAHFFASNNLALPADRFRAIGGFNPVFPLAAGEDRELCDRWLSHGYHMTYAPEVVIYHAHALTFRTFWRQQFNYGRGALLFHQARAWRTQKDAGLESLSFYLNLLRYPFSQLRRGQALMLAALLLMSQVAITAGFLWQGLNQTNRWPKQVEDNG